MAAAIASPLPSVLDRADALDVPGVLDVRPAEEHLDPGHGAAAPGLPLHVEPRDDLAATHLAGRLDLVGADMQAGQPLDQLSQVALEPLGVPAECVEVRPG